MSIGFKSKRFCFERKLTFFQSTLKLQDPVRFLCFSLSEYLENSAKARGKKRGAR